MLHRAQRAVIAADLAAVLLMGPEMLARADAPAGRYVVVNGTVQDTKTKLTWQLTPNPAKTDWSTGVSYCNSLPTDGGGWRLPTLNELNTIVDESRKTPAIDPTAFPNTAADFFWTSSTVGSRTDFIWLVTFNFGNVIFNKATTSNFVRCVRGSAR